MSKRRHERRDSGEFWRKLRRLEDEYHTSHAQRSFSDDDDCESDTYDRSCDDRSAGNESDNGLSSPERDPDINPNLPETPPDSDNAQASTSNGQEPTDNTAKVPDLPADILEALGESKEKEEKLGPKIREEVSKRWGKIVMEGLSKEQRDKLVEKILIPENFQLLKAPKLNPEISAIVPEVARNRDKHLERAQNHLGPGIAAVTNLLSSIIDGTDIEKSELIKRLSEMGQILLDLHSQNTTNRRKLVSYYLDKKFSNIVNGVKRDTFLFGDGLGEKIKTSKTAEKSELQIKRSFDPQPSTSSRSARPRQGNSRGSYKRIPLRRKPGPSRPFNPPQLARRYQRTTDNSSKEDKKKPIRKT